MSSPRPTVSSVRARHRPVMVREVLRWLEPGPGQIVVDGTVGAGGHATAILPLIGPSGRLIGLDRDPMMLGHAERKLAGSNATLIHSSYAELRAVLDRADLPAADRVLLDLGLSSDQLADRDRGFSFDADGPLDLRFDVSTGRPASQIVQKSSAEELTQIFRAWGEEPHAEHIARSIVAARANRDVTNARSLAAVIAESQPKRPSRGSSHPATRIFQALRIAANDELGELQKMLDQTLPASMVTGSRAVLISFHSLEDRLVKEAFRNRDVWRELTARPISATPSEIRINPRSRTARLRAAIRL